MRRHFIFICIALLKGEPEVTTDGALKGLNVQTLNSSITIEITTILKLMLKDLDIATCRTTR